MKGFRFFRGDIVKGYEIDGFKFLGCSGLYFDKHTLQPYRFKMFLHIETNAIITADIIYNDHPLFDIVYEGF